MANFKLNLFFAQGEQGWSETYYRTDTTHQNAMDRLSQLATRRSKLLGVDSRIIAQRVSDEAIDRDSLLQENVPYERFSYGGALERSDTPWQCAQVLLSSGAIRKRHIFLRGNPDKFFPEEIGEPVYNQYVVNMNAFTSWIRTDHAYTIKGISTDPMIAPAVRMSGLVIDVGAGTTTFTSIGPHGLVVGDTVGVYNIRGQKPQFGKNLVVATSTATFTILKVGQASAQIGLKSFFRKIVYDYLVIDDASWEDYCHRDTGRPFGVRRGRRPARSK